MANTKANEANEANGYETTPVKGDTHEIFGGRLPRAQALQKLRARLLDLSTRNQLLRYRHPKNRSLQFVHVKNLDTLYERLIDGKKAQLLAVPEPDLSQRQDKDGLPPERPQAKERAGLLGIDVSYDLAAPVPDSHPGRLGTRIQTLFYPADLEKLAKKIVNETRTAIEETGTNMLYLVFGFLEFYDTDASDRLLLAPLLSMPVSLVRDAVDPETRVYRYDLVHNGEDVTENFTLREKLKREFRMHLPTIGEDDSPETYFKAIQDTIKTRHRWKVRRQLSLAMLSFGKLAMWADLDPERWPALLDNALLGTLFDGGSFSGGELRHAPEHDIETHPQAASLPLIYAADSSRHSALIDAVAGKNMVINGPPGTGKSQTITNIIAASMADGKRVLFVSEKLAALEVVRSRLDKANLGDFCLELHSHKTQKKKFLEGLQTRWDKKFKPVDHSAKLAVLAERKRKLQRHAELMGLKVCNELGLTIHDIFWATARRRQNLGERDDVLEGVKLPNASTLTHTDLERHRTMLDALSECYCAADGAGPTHPWHGLSLGPLAPGDEKVIRQILEQTLAHARQMQGAAAQLDMLAAQSVALDTLVGMVSVSETLPMPPAKLQPQLLAAMFPSTDPQGHDSRKTIERIACAVDQIRIRVRVLRAGQYPTEADLAHAQTAISSCIGQQESFSSQVRSEPLCLLRDQNASLKQAITDFQAVLKIVQPSYVPAARDILSAAQSALQPLNDIAQIPLAMLKERGRGLGMQRSKLGEALDAVASCAKRWRLVFDGSTSAITGLVGAQGLLPTAEVSDARLTQACDLAQTPFGNRPIEALEQDYAKLQDSIQAMERSLGEMERAATETGQPFSGCANDITDLLALASIATDAPGHLMFHRSKAFEHPRMSEVICRAKDDHAKEFRDRDRLCRNYYLDALAQVDELKWAVRVFRQGDGVFNVFRSDWRKAKKLMLSMSQNKTKRPALEWSSECTHIIKWIEHRDGFLSNAEYREYFGELFDGVDTDFGKIDDLSGWYQDSLRRLMVGGTLVERIDLTTIDPRKIRQFASRATTLRQEAKTIRESLELAQAHLPSPIPIPAPEQAGWRKTIDAMKDGARTLEQVVGFFRPITQDRFDLTPLRVVELLHAKRELALRQESLVCCEQAIVAAVGPEFAGLMQRSVSTWAERLRDMDALIGQIAGLAAVLERFVSDDISPADAIRFLSTKVALDDAASAIMGAAVPTQATEWQEHVATACSLQENTDQLLTRLESFADAKQTANDVMAAMQASVEADQALRELKHGNGLSRLLAQEVQAHGATTDIDAVAATWQWATAVVEAQLPALAQSALLSNEAISNHGLLREHGTVAVRALRTAAAEMDKLKDFGALEWADSMEWSGVGGAACSLGMVTRLQAALDAADLIVPWSKYLAARQECSQSGFSDFIRLLEDKKLSPEHLQLAFERVFYSALGREIFRHYPELASFSGESHERIRADYQALDKEIISLAGLKIAHTLEIAHKIDGNKQLSAQMQLLHRELGKTRKHTPIRKLVSGAGRALQALKPCFMMGPLAVAQYLPPGEIDFDVIVMDEASQLRPEDALGAVARGKQLIVVGDPKQLPPTSFFNQMMDSSDDDDQEPAVIEDSESILDICQQLFSPVRSLKWHYRSQHESLIAFSNFYFYKNLNIFPSPYARGPHWGVSSKFVQDGVYKDRCNRPEADRIVSAILEHMIQHPDESLGVVSLNQTQRDLMQDLFDQKARAIAQTQGYLDDWEKKGLPFFIKNLENVQGDERDVIFISTTFGKAPGTSRPRQNFGPISRPDGWRRLNVLFTRSRKRLILFTSMHAEDIVVDAKSPAGTRALRDYLDYAKRGVLVETDHGDRKPDSDFEVAVADLLRNRGYEVKHQLGVANFFIDLAVHNPDRPGEYLAGIECDGATYHSTRSARDRDRIRQEILESVGWKGRIWRIWSTDWFYQPGPAIHKLLDFLDERRRLSALDEPTPIDQNGLEHDDGAGEPAQPGGSVPVDSAWSLSTDDAFVDIGDSITYCFLDTPQERHQVHIAEHAVNDGRSVVNAQAPLAVALLGLEAGEVGLLSVKGQRDRKVRVIKIEQGCPAVS